MFLTHSPAKIRIEREIKTAAAGVALSSATAAKLEVDASGLVAFGAEDVQSAHAGYDPPLDLHLFALLNLADQRVPFFLRHF
jgi:hypothetical protein